jgi:PelA/Pel-15E family pectate lyase
MTILNHQIFPPIVLIIMFTWLSPANADGYTYCSGERYKCSFDGTRVIRYGAKNSYFYRVAKNSVNCNNSTFGDPFRGEVKSCYYGPKVDSLNYDYCSKERSNCSASGPRVIRYGANDKYVYQVATDKVYCGNNVFGDPIRGVEKTCYYSGKADGLSDAPVLSQTGNPIHRYFERAKTMWGDNKADIVLSYQQDNGGWPKNLDYSSKGKGGNDIATIDNWATTTEMVYLATQYKRTKKTKYRDAVRKAMSWLLDAQYNTGGWPQFWPLKGGYADHVTFNDGAMANALTVLYHASEMTAPFDTDIFNDSDRNKMRSAIRMGTQYILKSQWKQGDNLTVWCAQHGKDDYLPKAARAYELESLSGNESVGIIGFLMTQPQTPEIEKAVKAALEWYRSSTTYVAGYTYDKSTKEKIVPKAGSRMWYRFYKLDTNLGFFSDRDGKTYYDIMDISEERRNGYTWGGNWGESIIKYADSVGY